MVASAFELRNDVKDNFGSSRKSFPPIGRWQSSLILESPLSGFLWCVSSSEALSVDMMTDMKQTESSCGRARAPWRGAMEEVRRGATGRTTKCNKFTLTGLGLGLGRGGAKIVQPASLAIFSDVDRIRQILPEKIEDI